MTKSKFPPKRPDNSHIIKAPVKLNYSEYQKSIFRAVARHDGHIIVEALAGSGKTTTLVESFKFVPKGKKVIALAFNKMIQEELRSRAPSYIQDVLTFHSLGYRAIKQRFGEVEIDNYKCFNLVKGLVDDEKDRDLITNICDTIAHCKHSLQDTPKRIEDIIDQFGIDLCEIEKSQFISFVIKGLSLCKAQTSKIDFDDMCYFPFVYNLSMGQYQIVYVDEYQDLNKNQLVMSKKICHPDGKLVIFGDRWQDLYSWRGSDSTLVEELKEKENTVILPLPVSYRCPKSVITLAQNWVPEITCPETAIEGEIKDISLNELYSEAKPGCFILSRVNAPLIKICLAFIRLGIKANIQGRDIGAQLAYLIKKSKKKQMPSFLTWLAKWKDEEVAKLQEKNINPENVIDRYECLINVCDESKSLEEATKKVNELFNDTDEKNVIILSSCHRAKGRERDNVFLLRWTFRVWFDHMDLIEKPNEEGNIAYVAATRAKKNLFVVRK
jgi:DNA helicase-2/ATP-dependent DNA helicase PcrA